MVFGKHLVLYKLLIHVKIPSEYM